MPGSLNSRRVRQLVSEFYEPLYRYAYRLTGRPDQAEDLTQEAFCRAQSQWAQLRDPDRPKPWLFAILRNCFLHDRRDQRTARNIPLDANLDVPEPLPEVDDYEIEPQRLQAVLSDLPEPYRTPLILFYFEDFSYRDIAEQMGVPIGTVMSRLARAKLFLRQRLVEPSAPVGVRHEL